MRDVADMQRRLRNSRRRFQRKGVKPTKFVHVFCGAVFPTLEEALEHDKKGGCLPSRTTARTYEAKGVRFPILNRNIG